MRDVIEHPVDEVFDVSGWDVRKALALLVKGNAAAGEWLRSPITYRGDAAARDLLLSTAAQVMPFDGLLGHHFHVATNNLDLARRTGTLSVVKVAELIAMNADLLVASFTRHKPKPGDMIKRVDGSIETVPPDGTGHLPVTTSHRTQRIPPKDSPDPSRLSNI